MKQRLATILLLLTAATAFTASLPRLALIGEPPELLDALTVELSSRTNLELLARAEIDLVLREHTVAADDVGQLVKLFPHTDIFALLTQAWDKKSGRMVVFNARNSFRLADVAWAGEATAATADLAQAIDSALRKMRNQTPVCFSIAAVRRVAIDIRQHSALDDWSVRFEHGLLARPEVQLLERERLGMVSEERTLTNQAFALAASGRLLTLEYETGDSAAVINLKLLCHDPGGRECLRLLSRDILKNPEETITRLVNELVDGLLAMPAIAPVAAQAQEEAKKLYQTYQNTGHPGEALQKIQAAVALAPDNEAYRHAEISASSFKLYCPGSPEGLSEARKLLAMIHAFQADFPGTTLPYFSASVLRDFADLSTANAHCLSEALARNEDEKVILLTQLSKDIEALYAEIRPQVRQDMRRHPQYAFDFTDGLSARDAKNFRHYLHEFYFMRRLYDDLEAWVRDYLSDYQLFLQQMERENLRRPYLHLKYQEMFLPYDQFLRHAPVEFRRFLERDQTFLDYLESSSLPFGRVNALELRTVLKLLKNSGRHGDQMTPALMSFFAELEALWPDCFTGDTAWKRILSEGCYAILAEQYYHLPRNHAAICLDRYLGRPELPLEDLLVQVSQGNGDDDAIEPLLRQTPSLHAWKSRYLTECKITKTLRDLSDALWEKPFFDQSNQREPYVHQLTPKQRELLLAINRPLDLEFGRFEDALKNDSPLVCCHACQDGDNVLLFLGQAGAYPKKPKAILASVAPDGSMRKLPYAVPFDARAVFYGEADWYNGYGLFCDQHLIVLANHWEVVVIERANGQGRTFRHEAKQFAGLAVQDDRIYILGNYLFQSMDSNGEKRKIHFSQQRADKLNDLDRGGRAHDLTAIGNGRLLFRVAHDLPKSVYDKEEIWLYDAGDDSLRCVLELPPGRRYALSSVRDAPFLVEAHKNRYLVHRLDPQDWQLHAVAQPPPADKGLWVCNVISKQDNGGSTTFPFILEDDVLWRGGIYPAVINLAAPEQSPLLWLPTVRAVFALEDKILFLRYNAWFTVQKKAAKAITPGGE
ncbi:MAG: hypothetical protein BWX73_00969 [Lentisphaerae bacterium ADurb.Bin082]|nr:MAG: hypothetical protein BWX73_00969 [Lentisphaerae bacterium ADurb.Bin082]HQL86346.1 hypothetical protein [Lentisphaeria bacterium]